MNEHSDTSDSTPLNTQAAAEGSYGSTLTSGRASLGDRSTDAGPLVRPVDGRADGSSRNTPADVSQLRRPGPRIANCIRAVDDGFDTALIWVKDNWFSVLDVALVVAGILVLVLHWRDEASVCFLLTSDCNDRGCTFELVHFAFSDTWRLWALAEVALKIIILGMRAVSSVRQHAQQ